VYLSVHVLYVCTYLHNVVVLSYSRTFEIDKYFRTFENIFVHVHVRTNENRYCTFVPSYEIVRKYCTVCNNKYYESTKVRSTKVRAFCYFRTSLIRRYCTRTVPVCVFISRAIFGNTFVRKYESTFVRKYLRTSVLRSPLPYTCTTLEEKTCTYRVFRSFKTGDGPLSFIDSASLPSCAYVLHPHATTHAVEEDLKSHKNGLSTARAFMTSRSKFSHLLII
jgi:hypothetical protein